MSDQIVGNLLVKIAADHAKLKADMDKAKQSVGDAVGVMKGALASLAAIGVSLSLAGFAAWIKGAIDAADATSKLSQKTGVAVKDLAGLELAFRLGGVGSNEMAGSIAKMSKQMAEGNAAFDKLGVKTRNADGTMRGVKDVLYDTADAFSGIKDGAGKSALVMEVFGRSGSELIPVLNGGAEGMREMADMAQKLGLTMSKETVTAAEKFNDTMELVHLSGQGVARQVMAELLPTMNSLAGAWLQATTEGDGLATKAEIIANVLKGLYMTVAVVAQGFMTFGKTLGALGAQIAALATGDFALMRQIGNEWVADIKGDWVSTIKNIGAAWDGSAAKTAEAMAKAAKAQRDLAIATKKQEEAAKAAAAAAAKVAEATRDYARSLDAKLAASALELAQGHKLTESQVLEAELRDKLLQGTIKLTAAELASVNAKIKQIGENKDAAKAAKEYADTLAAVAHHSTKLLDAETAQNDSLREQLVTLRDHGVQLDLGEEAYARYTNSNLRATAAELEYQAAMQGGNFTLEERARILRSTADQNELNTQKKASIDAAKAASDAWQSTADDIRGALTDALRRGFEAGGNAGTVFAKAIGNELKTRITAGIAAGLANNILGMLGMVATGAGGTGNSASGGGTNWLNLASNGQSLYQASQGGGIYGSALAAGNYGAVYSGSAYGTAFGSQQSAMLAAQESGMVSSAGGSAMSGAGAYAGYAALIYAAAKFGSSLYNKGFTGSDQVQGKGWYEYTPENFQTKTLKAIGLSDKWSEILGGSVRLNHMFGRAAPRVDEQGFQGSFGAGDFTGSAYADITEKGGLFRSDKKYTETSALSDEMGRYLDDAAKAVMGKAKLYGEALGLPVDALANVSTEIKVAFGDDEAKNQEELAKAIGSYGDALVAGYADALKPLTAYGETTVQTIERVATAINGVNGVLTALGLTALQASVDGGQAATELQNLFGGIGGLQQAASGYLQNYYTEAERANLTTQALSKAFAAFGVELPATRDAFRELVTAQDLTTASGRDAFTALMSVADAFASITEPARSAVDIANERADLERTLLELQGDTNELRRRERDAIDASNRGLYDQIQAMHDMADAASIAADAIAKAAADTASVDKLRASARAPSTSGGAIELFNAIKGVQAYKSATESDYVKDYISRAKEQNGGLPLMNESYLVAFAAGGYLKMQQETLQSYAANRSAMDAAAKANIAAADSSNKQLRDSLDKLTGALTDYRDSMMLGSGSVLSPEAQYELARQQFVDVAKQASAGDQAAAEQLQARSAAFRSQSQAYFGSGGGRAADEGLILDALTKSLELLGSISGSSEATARISNAGFAQVADAQQGTTAAVSTGNARQLLLAQRGVE